MPALLLLLARFFSLRAHSFVGASRKESWARSAGNMKDESFSLGTTREARLLGKKRAFFVRGFLSSSQVVPAVRNDFLFHIPASLSHFPCFFLYFSLFLGGWRLLSSEKRKRKRKAKSERERGKKAGSE